MLLRGILVMAALVAACHGKSASTTSTVGAGGGTAASADGAVTLTFPPGALAADTRIGIAPRAADADAIPGTAWDFTPDGAHFAQPVQVTMRWDPAKLQDADPSKLAMLHVSSDGSRVLAAD